MNDDLAAEDATEEARDRERFGGPVTSAMLHTALRSCAYDPRNPRNAYDLDHLARVINGWLTPAPHDDGGNHG